MEIDNDDIQQMEDEEDNNIKFPPEFKEKIEAEEMNICTISDLLYLFQIDKKKKENSKDKKDPDLEIDVYKKTKEYLDKFNKYGFSQNREEVPRQLRRMLESKKKFNNVEKALLIDLAPSHAEEAFALIPSLKSKLKTDELNDILIDLNKEIIGN